MLLATSLFIAGALVAPAPRLASPQRATRICMMSDEESGASTGAPTTGVGFGQQNQMAEERGRKALEALRAAQGEKGYDDSLQGLKPRPGDEPVEVPQEFKSTVTLGFAGFLIIGGIVSLFVGGSLWEPKGFDESGAPPPDEVASSTQQQPAFGFVPTAREREQVAEAAAQVSEAPTPQAEASE